MKQSQLSAGQLIDGVELITHPQHIDHRGSFVEVFKGSWDFNFAPVQWSIVKSKAKVFRGMHYHNRHDEYFCLVSGIAIVGLKDLRPDSDSYLRSCIYELQADQISSVYFPHGVLHGWYFPVDSVHLQGVSETYEDYSSDDNMGCFWGDQDLQIDWPFEDAILSDRAAGFPSLRALMRSLGMSTEDLQVFSEDQS
ncbi:MAG: dTDP-4-dehydrorhamnose 3,5-epimerase family protein [Saprospiraceae bacterium]|nr:dTDP-4-dehydrorhamnose 3,5-epimerase family protein [Saprospiraceae bacterium]